MKRAIKKIYTSLPMKDRAFRLLRTLGSPPKAIYQHLHFQGPVSISTGATKFQIWNHGHEVENDLFWAGYGNGWEATSLRIWARLAAAFGTILDVGSNTGVYALAAKSINPAATIFAFEPVERIAQKLERNIALNGFDIRVVRAAASDFTGEAVLFDTNTEHCYSASLERRMFHGPSVETKVATVRLDDFAKQAHLSSIDLVKVDVEKHELRVLRGMGELIEQHKPVLLVELLEKDDAQQIEKLLPPDSYHYYLIKENAYASRVPRLGKEKGNYLLCPPERQATLGLSQTITHTDL